NLLHLARSHHPVRKFLLIVVCLPLILGGGGVYFHQRSLPAYGPLYREYAYVTNGKSNTVSVIDLTTDPFKGFTVVRTLAVGAEPTGVAANPKRNEIYVVNAGSANVRHIDAEQNKVVATIGVYGRPHFIDISPDGRRAYVANSGSNNVSVLDLDHRTVAATLRVGASPGLARVSPDGSIVVVSNRADNSVSIIDAARLSVRSAISICLEPEDIAILPDSTKAFVSCSGSGQVASVDLKNDKLLALLDVGKG